MRLHIWCSLLLCPVATVTPALAQTGTWYMTDLNNGVGQTRAFRGGAQVLSWNWATPGEGPIYVDRVAGTVVQAPNSDAMTLGSNTGSIYTTAGAYVGSLTTAPNQTGAWDGAWDGSHSYMVDWDAYPNMIQQFGPNFSGAPTPLFACGPSVTSAQIGITFDSATGTLWTSDWKDGIPQAAAEVHQWRMDGVLLNSFVVPSVAGDLGALAYDPADDTFWVADGDAPVGTQFRRDGTILGTIALPTGQTEIGGEFGPVPAPGATALLYLGGLMAARRRRS